MIKNLLKYLSVAIFALFTMTAFAEEPEYTATVQSIKAAPKLLSASMEETNISIINWTNETIYMTAPLALTIDVGNSGWLQNLKYDGLTTIRLTNSKGKEIFNQAVFHRSTLDVRTKATDYEVKVKEHK